MANTFLTIKNIARQALPRLIENLVFPNLIYRDYSNDFEVGKGATIQVRRPVTLTAKEFTYKIDPQDVSEQSVEVTLNKLATVDVAFGALERAVNVDDLNRLFIEPAAVALAQKINADGLTLLSKITATAGSSSAALEGLEAFSGAAKVLDEAKVPLSMRRGVWSPEAMAEFRTVPSIVNAEKSGDTSALRAGSIGNIFGIENYMAQGVTGMAGAVFHQNAFAFVTRPLAAPAGVEAYTTSYNGITLRVVRGYDMSVKSEMLSMDVLYGYKTLDANMAVKVNPTA